jgi:hypothetical protein
MTDIDISSEAIRSTVNRLRLVQRDDAADMLEALRAALTAMTAERDSFRAVLEGAKYGDIDAIAKNTVEQSLMLGAAVKDLTLKAIARAEAAEATIVQMTVAWGADAVRVNELTAENARLRKAQGVARITELEIALKECAAYFTLMGVTGSLPDQVDAALKDTPDAD